MIRKKGKQIVVYSEICSTFATSNPKNEDEFNFSEYDYIVDAVDTVTAKISIIVNAKKNNIPIISSMGTGNKINPSMLEVSDIYKTSVDPLARVMRLELKKRHVNKLKVVYSKEIPLKPLEEMKRLIKLHQDQLHLFQVLLDF